VNHSEVFQAISAAMSTIHLRDEFAKAGMQGFVAGHISHYGHENHWPFKDLASEAYVMADEMLKARTA
jgi:hypothetical protein